MKRFLQGKINFGKAVCTHTHTHTHTSLMKLFRLNDGIFSSQNFKAGL